jgi:hypothetical protein
MRQVTWSAFSRNIATLAKRGPLLVTRHGKPACICLGIPKGGTPMGDAQAMLLLVAMGEADVAAGRTIPQAQVMKDLKQRLRERIERLAAEAKPRGARSIRKAPRRRH